MSHYGSLKSFPKQNRKFVYLQVFFAHHYTTSFSPGNANPGPVRNPEETVPLNHIMPLLRGECPYPQDAQEGRVPGLSRPLGNWDYIETSAQAFLRPNRRM